MNRVDYKYRFTMVQNYLNVVNIGQEIIDYYKGKYILVTGGAGAIGSNLSLTLSILVGPTGRIIILDNLSSIKKQDQWNIPSTPNIKFIKGDIRMDKYLKLAFSYSPNIIFHLASFFANQKSVDYPEDSISVDVQGLIKILEYSKLSKVEKFIYASSGCAIGKYSNLPIKEVHISMDLSTPYQINKLTGEMFCNFYNRHYGLRTVNCRLFNSYGPGEIPGKYRNVIPNFIYFAKKKEKLVITGTGEESRDFTYVLDLIQGLLKAGYYESAIGEGINVASSVEIKIIDLAQMINKLIGNEAGLLFAEKRKWDKKIRVLASIEKSRKLIHYNPIISFENGLKENITWFNNNWDKINQLADF